MVVINKYITGIGRSCASRKIDKDCINTKTHRAQKNGNAAAELEGETRTFQGRREGGEKQLRTGYNTIYYTCTCVMNVRMDGLLMMMIIIMMKFILQQT